MARGALIRGFEGSCRVQIRRGFVQIGSTPTWRRVCHWRPLPPLSPVHGMHRNLALSGLGNQSNVDLFKQRYPRLGSGGRGDGRWAG